MALTIRPSLTPSTTPGGSSASSGSSSAGTTKSSTGQTFVNATQGPYTLTNAQATGGVSAPVSTTGDRPISFTMDVPTAPVGATMTSNGGYYILGGTTPQSSGGGGTVTPTTIKDSTTGPYTKANANSISSGVKNTVTNYGASYIASKGDRTAYNTSVGYDKLSTNQKRLADLTYEKSKKRSDEEKKTGTPLNPYSVDYTTLVNDPEAEKNRLIENEKKMKDQADKGARDKALENANLDKSTMDTLYSTEESEVNKDITNFEKEQNESATQFEGNRLNQVRGDIMQALAQRGVDISKIAPEQMIELSGEKGSRAFTDIFVAKEKVKSNIRSARDKAMAKLSELRNNKAINETTYRNKVASINELTNSKLIENQKNYTNSLVSLYDTTKSSKDQAVTTAYNILGTAGVKLTDLQEFIPSVKSSTTTAEVITKLADIAKTNPKAKAVLDKINEANVAAAQLEADKINAQIVASTKTADTSSTERLKMIDILQNQADYKTKIGDTEGANVLRARIDQIISGTSSGGAGTSASPSWMIN